MTGWPSFYLGQCHFSIFCSESHKDHSCEILMELANWFESSRQKQKVNGQTDGRRTQSDHNSSPCETTSLRWAKNPSIMSNSGNHIKKFSIQLHSFSIAVYIRTLGVFVFSIYYHVTIVMNNPMGCMCLDLVYASNLSLDYLHSCKLCDVWYNRTLY